jgi:hypothetical protein
LPESCRDADIEEVAKNRGEGDVEGVRKGERVLKEPARPSYIPWRCHNSDPEEYIVSVICVNHDPFVGSPRNRLLIIPIALSTEPFWACLEAFWG